MRISDWSSDVCSSDLLPALLAKRALAAVDGNFLWEALDCLRRAMAIALLLFILQGLDPRMSVALQLCVSIAVIGYAIALVHRRLGLRARHWLSFRVGGGPVRRHSHRAIVASSSSTLSQIR